MRRIKNGKNSCRKTESKNREVCGDSISHMLDYDYYSYYTASFDETY